jgi:ABC-type nitrate/sulfonate/bicarbonate transport system permease component
MMKAVHQRLKVVEGSFPRISINGEMILSVVSPLVLVLLWEGLVRLGYLEELFFPPPSKITRTLIKLTQSGALVAHVLITMRRVLLGFFLGAVPGIILGLMMGSSKKIRAVVDPIIATTYPMPKIALLPLIMLIFGIGDPSKVVTIASGVFYLLVVNCMTGVCNIEPIYFEAARNYGAGRLRMFTKVLLPGSLPVIFAGIRLGLGVALLIAIAIELVSARQGLGAMIWLAWQTLKTEVLYVGVFICAVLGLLSTAAVELTRRKLIPWEQEVAVAPVGELPPRIFPMPKRWATQLTSFAAGFVRRGKLGEEDEAAIRGKMVDS